MGVTPRILAVITVITGLAVGGVLGGCACPKIQQEVYVATPDATLAPLVEACRTGVPLAGHGCVPSTTGKMVVSCACLPLCQRVMELIDQFSGDETLISCNLLRAGSGPGIGGAGGAGASAGGGGRGGTGAATDTRPLSSRPGTVEVAVTYRPSTCE